MAPHSNTLAWKIPWMEEPGRLQSMGSLRVGHDWATSLSVSCIGEGNGNPLQCSCLENPRDGGARWAAVSGVAQSRTRLEWLSSSSSHADHLLLHCLLWSVCASISPIFMGCLSSCYWVTRDMHIFINYLSNIFFQCVTCLIIYLAGSLNVRF